MLSLNELIINNPRYTFNASQQYSRIRVYLIYDLLYTLWKY